MIELCATGVGFDGTKSKDCINYYTGDVWKGAAKVSSYVNYPEGSATCKDSWAIKFAFSASDEGTIEGQGTAELTSGPTCTFPVGPAVQHVEYLVKGEKTTDGFSVRFELGTWQPDSGEAFYGGVAAMWSGYPGCSAPVEVTVSGNSGTGEGAWKCQSGNPPATYGANGTFELTCVSCKEPEG